MKRLTSPDQLPTRRVVARPVTTEGALALASRPGWRALWERLTRATTDDTLDPERARESERAA